MAATTRLGRRGIFAHRPLRPGGAATALIVTATLLAGCSTGRTDETHSPSATLGSTVSAGPTTSEAPPPSVAPTPALDIGPFASDDLEDLVLRADEGEGLVDGLSYSASYSGSADLRDVHHWTLVSTERMEAAGFIEAYSGMFMTPAFPGTFAREGRSLATAVLLFEDPQGARRGLRIFRSTRAETWDVWEPLTIPGGFGTIGRLGSDNVSVVYPTVGFMGRVGNMIVMVGSQGGSYDGRPLPVDVLRGIAYDLLARARARLEGS